MLLTVTPDLTASEIHEAITHLRRQQRCTHLTSMAERLGEQMDALLDELLARR